MVKKRLVFSFLFIFIISFVLTACGSSNADYSSNTATSNYSAEQLQFTSAEVTASKDAETPMTIQQKLIYKGEISLDTKHFDDTVTTLTRSLSDAGGYIVSQADRSGDFSYRYTTFEIRIPSEHFFSWVQGVEQIPDIKISKNIYTEDVSEEYVDLKAREEAKQVVIDKYLEYMQLATTADELIRFTNELAVLQEEIEAVQARLRYLDHQVSYSTLTIFVKEINEHSFFAELNMGLTIKRAFENGITGFVAVVGFIISTIIVLIPFILLGIFIWAIVYLISKSQKNRKQARLQQQPPLNPLQQPIFNEYPPQPEPPSPDNGPNESNK